MRGAVIENADLFGTTFDHETMLHSATFYRSNAAYDTAHTLTYYSSIRTHDTSSLCMIELNNDAIHSPSLTCQGGDHPCHRRHVEESSAAAERGGAAARNYSF